MRRRCTVPDTGQVNSPVPASGGDLKLENLWQYRWLLLQGTSVTLLLGLCGLALAMAIGLAGAAAKLGGSPWARRVAGGYTTFVRSVPDLCMMLLLYFGGQTLLNKLGAATGWWDYLEINSFAAGVITIGFIYEWKKGALEWD